MQGGSEDHIYDIGRGLVSSGRMLGRAGRPVVVDPDLVDRRPGAPSRIFLQPRARTHIVTGQDDAVIVRGGLGHQSAAVRSV